jgi:unsaturated chondroitin disaccharide hydrolase
MIAVDPAVTAASLRPRLERLFELSAGKIAALERRWDPADGAPVFTRDGRYTTRGWTEWTQGFQYGAALLQFDATGEGDFLDLGLRGTREVMARHVSHVGVHDHGFNNASTYGTLRRLVRQGRLGDEHLDWAELALKVSGAVQAARWTRTADGGGFVYSFNGPHSLFVDTIRSMRSLALAHQLGHALMAEGDRPVSLLDRLVAHALATARYNVYYGEGRDAYDLPGRTAHEAIFNVVDGNFRCPSTQQGYSPFTTWTRGLAWAMLGFAEQLEFLETLPEDVDLAPFDRACAATCDFYLATTPPDGVPYWDTGAPGLAAVPDHRDHPADPYAAVEPVDGSAAAIAAQALLRYGRWLTTRDRPNGDRYRQAGLTVARTLLDEPYLSTDPAHEGLLLHVIYHRPNGWDHVPPGAHGPCRESAMWGDYHLRELALLLLREARGDTYLTFFS